MKLPSGITFEQGALGRRATLTSEWRPEYERLLLEEKVAEIELNDGKGWRGRDIHFLESFPELQGLTIIDLSIGDVNPIHSLYHLRRLQVITYCKTRIDFRKFPFLDECGLEWRKGADSLFRCKTLRHLFINRYSGRDTDEFPQLLNLESLILLNSPAVSLGGVGKLAKLRKLRIGNLYNLASLAGIGNLTRLDELEIQRCTKVFSIDELSRLKRLRKVLLEDMGKVETLKPLAGLQDLESIIFDGTTNIADGDLTVLKSFGKLSTVSFQNRRHYTHRREDFGNAYFHTE